MQTNPALQRQNSDLPVEGAVEASREIGKLHSGASKPEFGEVFA